MGEATRAIHLVVGVILLGYEVFIYRYDGRGRSRLFSFAHGTGHKGYPLDTSKCTTTLPDGVVVNQRCLPGQGPNNPSIRGPMVTQPLDPRKEEMRRKEDAVNRAFVEKQIRDSVKAQAKAMERIMQNIGRRSTQSSGRQNTGTTQTYDPSSGGSTQVNTITLCRLFNGNKRLCDTREECRWDGRSRCL